MRERGGATIDIHVRQQRLPGVGYRYEFPIGDGQKLVVIAHTAGQRDLSVTRAGSTEPDTYLTLDQGQATTLAALLIGATFSIDTTDDDQTPTSEVVVETVTLGSTSPALGRTIADIDFGEHADAVVLALISDETPELVEDPTTRACRPGDRIVIAAPRDQLEAITRLLAG